MSISISPAAGGRKPMGVDLNVVPFIDFLSCLIAFLMLGAVWTQLSAIDVEQSLSPPNPIDDPNPPAPPLTLHVEAAGVWVGHTVEDGVLVPMIAGAQDWRRVSEVIGRAPDGDTDAAQVVLNTDDGVPYEQMVAALDLTREHGYTQTLLAGGAPSGL